MNFTEGEVLLIDKPLDWTSFDVVNKLKYQLKRQYGAIKIGHAGTLDPRATGLLIVCTGKKTKIIESIQHQTKTYSGSFCLGAYTESYDTEQPISQTQSIDEITEDKIYEVASLFIGEQLQIPPIHSAVRIDGKRAYSLARKGKTPELKPKPITIYKFEITKIELPFVFFVIECSKGTYIRSIANDFGKKLNNLAYLHTLRREQIGSYSIKDAYSIDELIVRIKETNNEK